MIGRIVVVVASLLLPCLFTACATKHNAPAAVPLSRSPSGVAKSAAGPLASAWHAYVAATRDEAVRLIDDTRYASFLVDAVPPSGQLARAASVADEHVFGDFGQMTLGVDGNIVTWLAMRRGTDGVWRLTLDEKRILDVLTEGWPTTVVGKLVYHTRTPMSPELRQQAEGLAGDVRRFENLFGVSPPLIDYYLVEPGPHAIEIAGETNFGAGQARRRLIKAVGIADHAHELAHVFALEVSGYANRFLDEGIATALANKPMLKTRELCKPIQALISANATGYVTLFDSDRFTAAHGEGWAYPLAQITMQHWIDRVGLPKVMEVMSLVAQGREPVASAVERLIEPRASTNEWLSGEVRRVCDGLAAK